MPSEEEINQIAKMRTKDLETGQDIPDTKAQLQALQAIRTREQKENKDAIDKQNEWAATHKVCWGRPVAGAEGSIYDAFMHVSCANASVNGGKPEGWTKLFINDTNNKSKCIGCGFVIGKSNGN